MTKIPTAPEHLSAASRAWWRLVAKAYTLAEHQYRTLSIAAEAWDTKERARETLAREGLTFRTKYDELRPHPCVSIERDARIGYLRAVRELALDIDEPSDARPPRPAGRYAGRA